MYKSAKDKEIDEIKQEVKKNFKNRIKDEVIQEFTDDIERKFNDKLVEYYKSTAQLMAEISVMNITGIEQYNNISHLKEIDHDFRQISKMYQFLLLKLDSHRKKERERRLEEKRELEKQMKLEKNKKNKKDFYGGD